MEDGWPDEYFLNTSCTINSQAFAQRLRIPVACLSVCSQENPDIIENHYKIINKTPDTFHIYYKIINSDDQNCLLQNP